MKKEALKLIDDFLRESNAIEGVYDADSLHQAHLAWSYLAKKKVLTSDLVLKVHKILMKNHLNPDEKGCFRRCEVTVGGRYGLPFREVPQAMIEWILDAMTSVEIPGEDGSNIKIDHIEYERIHPFVDGNGRTGRIFMNWQRMKAGLPILVLKEAERQEYYKWFA